ncbi:MAG TPA: CBS domain-containing protein [Polyangiaceae bacterium]|nr:CBS domain-containing protein [Polyangiaceae bacterium]
MDDSENIEEELRIQNERSRPPKMLTSAAFLQPILALRKAQELEVVPPTATISHAIGRMQARRIGAILVVQDGKLAGIVTERDILLKVTGAKTDVGENPVSTVMTPNPEYLMLDDQVAYLLNAMRVGGFRHVPIVNDKLEPLFVVSLRDVLAFIVDNFPEEVINIPSRPFRGTPNEYGG